VDLTLYRQITFSVIIIVVLYFLSVNTMSERSYNLRPRAKTRSQSETRPSFGHEPSTPTGRTESPTTLTGEKRPAPGQHPVLEVVGIAPRSEMGSRPVLSLIPGDMDSTPAGERVLSLERVDAGSSSVVRSSSDIVVTEVAAAGASLIEFSLPATVASPPSQPNQSVDVYKQTWETPAATHSDRPLAVDEDLRRPAMDMVPQPPIDRPASGFLTESPAGPGPRKYASDVDKHGPPARPFMTDADRQSVVRPDVYSSLSTTSSYEYSSLSVDSLLTQLEL